MFLESFRHLIEIEALKTANQQNILQIASENKRISDLDERRNKTVQLNENLKIEEKNLKLTESQNHIEDQQIRLRKLNSQLSLSVTEKEQVAFEHQIQLIKDEIEKLETLYFTNLEKSEEIQNTIKENLEFLAGSQSTLEDIKKEVKIAVEKEQAIIDGRQVRIDALTDQLHPSMKSLYLSLEKSFKPKSPVSYLIDKKCSACYMQTDASMKASLEEGRSLETCPTCSRLLIPETAKIY